MITGVVSAGVQASIWYSFLGAGALHGGDRRGGQFGAPASATDAALTAQPSPSKDPRLAASAPEAATQCRPSLIA
jgi:hypothetical protein